MQPAISLTGPDWPVLGSDPQQNPLDLSMGSVKEDAYVQRASAAKAPLPGRDEARHGLPAVCYVGPPAATLRPTARTHEDSSR
jgi:hypothetical protein